jgi:hypothetical protein
MTAGPVLPEAAARSPPFITTSEERGLGDYIASENPMVLESLAPQ